MDGDNLTLKNITKQEIDNLFTNPQYDKLFQLLVYAYIYNKDQSVNSTLKTTKYRCGIISFQELMKKNDKTILYAQFPTEEISKETYCGWTYSSRKNRRDG